MLTTNTLRVDEVAFGKRTECKVGRLTLDKAAVEAELKQDRPGIKQIRIALAHPGDATRILCCKDVIQPSHKLEGTAFRDGARLLLEGVAVVTQGPIVGYQEGIIDMSGPGARRCLFSRLHLVVVEVEPVDELDAAGHEALVREVGLAIAELIARVCANAPVWKWESFNWNEEVVAADLPRIAYVYMVLSQGLLHDTYLNGENAANGLPIDVDPRIVLDGALVSGNCVSACDKNTTWHHRNNPVVSRLLAGHGSRWNFVGVVIANVATRLEEKRRITSESVALVAALHADGAVVTKEGFGNPDADFMMLLRGMEERGIKCVGITDEFAGCDGASQSLADASVHADALVSTGNANERLLLPAMDTVLGPLPDVERLAGGYSGSLRPTGELEVELQAIMGATNELGHGYLACREA